jgi:hypothetical protein
MKRVNKDRDQFPEWVYAFCFIFVLVALSLSSLAYGVNRIHRCDGHICIFSPSGPNGTWCDVKFVDAKVEKCTSKMPCASRELKGDCYYDENDEDRCYTFDCPDEMPSILWISIGCAGAIISCVLSVSICIGYRKQIKKTLFPPPFEQDSATVVDT